MKKLLVISAILLAASVTKSEAQYFVASYGVQHQWGVPDYVTHMVYDRFHNYDWVHTSRIHHGAGHVSFNILLQRGNRFLEVNVNNHGYTQVINRYNYYPMGGHVCGDFCGYHEYYYDTYYNICHSHNHYGHNHIAYRPRPVTYVYGNYRTYPRYYYQAPTTVIYKNAPVKEYKKHKKEYNPKPQYSERRPARVEYDRRTDYGQRRTGDAPRTYTVKNEEKDNSRSTRVSSESTRGSQGESRTESSVTRRSGRGN